MTAIAKEPLLRVGLMTGADEVRFALSGRFASDGGSELVEGDYSALIEGEQISVIGPEGVRLSTTRISPLEFDSCRVTVHGITIGVDFHWQRKESQTFQGALGLLRVKSGITVINEIPLESYLTSVISSEMSASCPVELLRAHAIVSRSWLLSQLVKEAVPGRARQRPGPESSGDVKAVIVRWYDRENHADFDVCADDHCQRYQGISKASSGEAFNAIETTRGVALTWGEEICDARYSKSCGGMTELFGAAWKETDVPYLAAIYDGDLFPEEFSLPLTAEQNAESWIKGSPPAYCAARSRDLLARILPGFDQETQDFYRWQVDYSQEELAGLVRERTGVDLGRIADMTPLERGASGRIIRLRIRGEKGSLVVGKELEIRRALSRSHLYSSAFVAESHKGAGSDYPERFTLRGAGWGHGVGLCQIGAAVMADRGIAHQEILTHYFRGASLSRLY